MSLWDRGQLTPDMSLEYVNTWPVAQCTWWVANFFRIPWGGNASDWLAGAQAAGWPISSTPQVGDIAWFQPGTDGAFSDGHVGVVTSVGNGNYTISEDNFNGSSIPDTRTVNLSPYQRFITPPTGTRTPSFASYWTQAANGSPIPSGIALTSALQSGVMQSDCMTLGEKVQGGLPVISGATGFFGWIAQPCVWKRILIVGASGLFIIFGLKFAGQPEPARILAAPMQTARKLA